MRMSSAQAEVSKDRSALARSWNRQLEDRIPVSHGPEGLWLGAGWDREVALDSQPEAENPIESPIERSRLEKTGYIPRHAMAPL